MRITSQSMDTAVKPTISKALPQATQVATENLSNNTASIASETTAFKINTEKSNSENTAFTKQYEISKENLAEAVDKVNEFLHIEKRSAKFVFHEGLDKYYVKLVDPDTEEVIKEIPPERLLDAFYEMQKLAGMIVDEKI